MKSRRQTYLYWVIALTIVVGAALAWQRYSQPRFQGKTMAEWLDQTPPTSLPMTGPVALFRDHTEFTDLLQRLGTNALQPLIALLDEGDSTSDHWMSATIRSGYLPTAVNARFKSSLDQSARRRTLAASAIQHLGTNALTAIPFLEEIIRDPSRHSASVHAISILTFMGPPALPALQRSVTNAPENRKASVEQAIVAIHRTGIKSPYAKIRESSLLALAETPYATFEMMIPLAELLDSPNPDTRRRALHGLAEHLPIVAPSLLVAYRAVERQTSAKDPEMRRVATELLAKLNAPPQENRAATISNSRIQ